MGKSCWRARLGIQQFFRIEIFLPFLIFKLLLNFIFQCYRPQTWQSYLVFPALFISGTHKVPGLITSDAKVRACEPCEPCFFASTRLCNRRFANCLECKFMHEIMLGNALINKTVSHKNFQEVC